MKTNRPSLLANLLLTATQTARRFFAAGPQGLAGAQANVLFFQPEQNFAATERSDECFVIDALIQPATPDAEWQPGDLILLSPEAVETDTPCRMLGAEVLEARRFQDAADRTCVGPRRVRLRVAVRPGVTQLCFRHRDTQLGMIVLPEAPLLAA